MKEELKQTCENCEESEKIKRKCWCFVEGAFVNPKNEYKKCFVDPTKKEED